jgi:serine/threonine protein kinase
VAPGTSKVWGVTDRARALIEALLPNEPQAVKQMAMMLRSMADLCIFIPGRDAFHSASFTRAQGRDSHAMEEPLADGAGESSDQRTARVAAERAQARRAHSRNGPTSSNNGEQELPCGDAEVEATLQQRDPQGVGLPSATGRQLLLRLLAWSPDDRITAQEALLHPYFAGSSNNART